LEPEVMVAAELALPMEVGRFIAGGMQSWIGISWGTLEAVSM